MKTNEYTKANRDAWNESARFHADADEFTDLLKGFAKPGYSSLGDMQTSWLEDIGIKGKSVVQVCCNKGAEILSIENLGAANCVGIDISKAFLDQARQLAKVGNLSCKFIESDIYELPDHYDGQFDLCVITIGVFGWMPDLDAFFKRVARLLKPGGMVFINEEHPIMNMFEPEAENPFLPVNSYFKETPFVESKSITYDGKNHGDAATHYWFVHPLSKVFTCILDSGLYIDAFEEYDFNISSAEFDIYETQQAKLPMSYGLLAVKE